MFKRFFAVLLFIILSGFVYAQVIKSIEITGLDAVTRGTVLSYLPIEVDDVIQPNTSNNIISALYKSDLFSDISVNIDNGIIKIQVREKPHIYNINISGYSGKVIEEESLNVILTSVRLTRGEIFSQQTLNKLVSELKKSYIESGYYLANIKVDTSVDNNNRVNINIEIDEGDIVRIRSMQIVGNKDYEEDDLLDEFEIGEPDFFLINYFTKKDHYSKAKLNLGLKKITTFYKDSGYIDFNINKVLTPLSADKKFVDIKIEIFEGQPYRFGKVRFLGDFLGEDTTDIKDSITFKSGQIYSQKALVESAQNIADKYTKQGYAFVDITPIIEENPASKTVDIGIPLRLSHRVYVNRILIRGNFITQDEVVRRELVQTEGSVYSSEAVQKSLTNLRRLGYFSKVDIQIERLVNKDKVNLIFSVEEVKTGNFTIGLSYSDSLGLSYNLGIQERNFLGTGNTLNVHLIQGNAVEDYGFNFVNPHFNNQGHSINYGIRYREVDADELDISDYSINTTSVHFGYGLPVSEDSNVNATVYFADHDLICTASFTILEQPLLEDQCGDSSEYRISLSWIQNTLNRFRFPSDGSNITVSGDFAIGDFQYIKADIKYDYYQQLSKDLVLKLTNKFGIGKGINDKDLPFFRRYFAGGENLVRGYSFNTLGEIYSDGNAKGGEVLTLARAAVITKVPFIRDSSAMRISGFFDIGNIYDSLSDFEVGDLRASVGIGFEWVTLLGPISLSYAIPVNDKSGDSIDNFTFSLGKTF